jgi:putative flippase GtrA
MRTKKKTKKLIIQFAEYMISGGAWFWVGYGAFAFMDLALGISFWVAKISSYFIGASVNFLLQRFWVFKQKGSKKDLGSAAKRYYSLMAFNFVLDQGIVGGLREIGVTPYIGQFVASGFFTVWNWLWYSLWVFKKQKPTTKRTHKHQHSPALHRNKHARRSAAKSKTSTKTKKGSKK